MQLFFIDFYLFYLLTSISLKTCLYYNLFCSIIISLSYVVFVSFSHSNIFSLKLLEPNLGDNCMTFLLV